MPLCLGIADCKVKMFTKEEKFNRYLKSKRLKFTPERKIILQEVFSFHKHFNADQLFEKLHQKNRQISRATVYRTLPLLVESGLIVETLRCQGKVSYEQIFKHKHHGHLVCIKCGRVIEFRQEEIEKLQNAVCEKYNFKAVEHKLGIRGYCRRCLSRYPALREKNS